MGRKRVGADGLASLGAADLHHGGQPAARGSGDRT
jgi:hypothetical protein